MSIAIMRCPSWSRDFYTSRASRVNVFTTDAHSDDDFRPADFAQTHPLMTVTSFSCHLCIILHHYPTWNLLLLTQKFIPTIFYYYNHDLHNFTSPPTFWGIEGESKMENNALSIEGCNAAWLTPRSILIIASRYITRDKTNKAALLPQMVRGGGGDMWSLH